MVQIFKFKRKLFNFIFTIKGEYGILYIHYSFIQFYLKKVSGNKIISCARHAYCNYELQCKQLQSWFCVRLHFYDF